MKYFIDTEFLEGTQKEKFPVSLFRKETKPTIDLISMGIVAEDGREYYAISKDFNLKEAWNRWQLRTGQGDRNYLQPREYWIRENVLYPIFLELAAKNNNEFIGYTFTYKLFEKLICKYGKTNKQIAEEVKEFVNIDYHTFCNFDGTAASLIMERKSRLAEQRFKELKYNEPKFYGYFADYDWVAFCWLFDKMMDLPKGFPMYCIDLKQILDEKAESLTSFELSKLAHTDIVKHNVYFTYDTGVLKCSKTDLLKNALNYPKQTNEHNALADAKWNKQLYEFLQTI
jgi:hypothetical protein